MKKLTNRGDFSLISGQIILRQKFYSIRCLGGAGYFFENFRRVKNFLLELNIGLKFEVFLVKFGEKWCNIPQN
jgi:hypothetical protein